MEFKSIKKVCLLIIIFIIVFTIALIINIDKFPSGNQDNINKLVSLGFSQTQSEEVDKILTQCSLGDIGNTIEPLDEREYSDIKKEDYNKAYQTRIYDKKVSEFRTLNLYFNNDELIYMCNSNHMIQYYSIKDGVINDSHRLFTN